MISHAYKCIFIHQRKCAGTSLIDAFGITPASPDWHFANDGLLSPEFSERPRDYLVFSVVRNPWDRLISAWKYLPSTRFRPLKDVIRNPPRCGHDFRHLTRPQSAILFDRSGSAIFDALLRFENLQADFDSLCRKLGKPSRRLPKLNRTSHRSYKSYYDAEAVALAGSLFAEDIRRFGYAFERRSSSLSECELSARTIGSGDRQ